MSDIEPNDSTDLSKVVMGIGTWAWGDRLIWGYGRHYGKAEVRQAFEACEKAGVIFFDTAEAYGQGTSESLLGQFCRDTSSKILIASKFMPYPWRLTKSQFQKALRSSLSRLDRQYLDLYQIHWPIPPVRIETWMESMAEAVQSGLIRQVGVSNFNSEQTQRAYDTLARLGVHLFSNQVEYHLLNRKIETNGLLSLCRALGIKVIAYSPLAQGVLTGKYTPQNLPRGLRARHLDHNYLQQIQPLISLMKKIGTNYEGKSVAQVAINWTICMGTLPIPGVKNSHQVDQNVGSLGWSLSSDDVNELLDVSTEIIKKIKG
jgi:aryl-alcohol dehydrogenase-like predicted oxidoreductase